MTDTSTNPQDAAGGGASRASMWLGGGLAVVLLAAIGATGGWLLAGDGEKSPGDPLTAATTTNPPSSRATSARPSTGRATPSAVRTSATPTKGTGLTVPPVIGVEFVQARDMLREHRLGWRLVFGGGAGSTVESAVPAVGTEVARGTTVQLQVTGPAPAAEVPDVVGKDCAKAVDELIDEGLYPRYISGRNGKVARQEPVEDGSARWNDEVSIWCGAGAPEQPSTKPTP
ncbi:PASTA domain-containing protein [Micromonospora sp. NPDC048905]|uniref:PASTA domain-containing protein n=1 Tax=Micromonospora sp. NPDC048905 TaxID=3155494 RepID=UPI0033D12843